MEGYIGSMAEGDMMGLGVGVWGWDMEVAMLWVGVFEIAEVLPLTAVE